MAIASQTRYHHLLRLTPVEINLKMLAGTHGLQSQTATNEIGWTGGAPQIQIMFWLGIMHPSALPKEAGKKTTLVVMVLLTTG